MRYVAYISKEGRHTLAEFPDCPGCQTFSDSDDLAARAHEALEGWLEAHLTSGQIPPRPVEHAAAPKGAALARVPVRAGLAAALEIRWARNEAGLSQSALGKMAGVSQQQIAKLEDPDENPSLETLEKVARALGVELSVGFERPDPMPALAKKKSPRAAKHRFEFGEQVIDLAHELSKGKRGRAASKQRAESAEEVLEKLGDLVKRELSRRGASKVRETA